MAGGPQRGLRLGEARVHGHGVPWTQDPGQQHEGLGRAGGEQYLRLVPPVPRRRGTEGSALVGVGAEPVQRALQPAAQPRRRRGGADVDGEVQQAPPSSASPW
jgi:hypothetical protein